MKKRTNEEKLQMVNAACGGEVSAKKEAEQNGN